MLLLGVVVSDQDDFKHHRSLFKQNKCTSLASECGCIHSALYKLWGVFFLLRTYTLYFLKNFYLKFIFEKFPVDIEEEESFFLFQRGHIL